MKYFDRCDYAYIVVPFPATAAKKVQLQRPTIVQQEHPTEIILNSLSMFLCQGMCQAMCQAKSLPENDPIR